MTMTNTEYLLLILNKYKSREIDHFTMVTLHSHIRNWCSNVLDEIKQSGSKAKGTAISIASDVDYLISIENSCTNTLKEIYESLYNKLDANYSKVRKQNVSIRITLPNVEIDVTPAKKQSGNTNDHSVYVSKKDTWKMTNIQRHINDISNSGRINEIKLLKIWREKNKLDFSSTYLEYLLINEILYGKNKGIDYLENNLTHIFRELSKTREQGNPLFITIIDPANSNNILSDLLTDEEKKKIIGDAKRANDAESWLDVFGEV